MGTSATNSKRIAKALGFLNNTNLEAGEFHAQPFCCTPAVFTPFYSLSSYFDIFSDLRGEKNSVEISL